MCVCGGWGCVGGLNGAVQEGWCALHCACLGGAEGAAVHLLRSGCSVGQRSRVGACALHYASLRDRGEVVDRLLDSGADVRASDEVRAHRTGLSQLPRGCVSGVCDTSRCERRMGGPLCTTRALGRRVTQPRGCLSAEQRRLRRTRCAGLHCRCRAGGDSADARCRSSDAYHSTLRLRRTRAR